MSKHTIRRGTLVTADILRDMCACEDQVATFEELFPDGAALRLKNLLKAARAGLDLGWFAVRILPAALRAFDEGVADAEQAFDEAIAPALWQASR